MIPFPILSKIRSVTPSPEYPKFFLGQDAIFVLYENGELYGRGSNRYGKLGLGIGNGATTYITEWTKLHSNVRLVATGSAITVIITNDNKVLYAGDIWFKEGANVSANPSFSNVWFDVTNRMGTVDISTVVKMKCTFYSCGFLTSSKKLYVRGFDNSSQFGSPPEKPTAVLISSNVINFWTIPNASVYLDTNNAIWQAGTASSSQFGASGSPLANFTGNPDPKIQPISDYTFGNSSSMVLRTDENLNTTYFAVGNNTSRQMGLPSQSIYNVYTTATSYNNLFGSFKSSGLSSSNSIIVDKTNTRLYICGDNSHYSLGVPNSTTYSAYVLQPQTFQNITDICYGSNANFVADDKTLYYSGNALLVYGLKNVSTFTPITLPR